MPKKIAVIVGSLRQDSLNRQMAKALIEIAAPTLKMEIIEIANLPLYNQDDDANPSPEVIAFREKIKPFDGVLFVTPEYNRSMPGVLKNAIDTGSRPYGQSVWDKKPCAIVSVSPGAIGGFGSNHHLRQSLVFLNMPTMQQPEAYIGNATTLLDNGKITNEKTMELMKRFIELFTQWVELHTKT